jgi:hypothetical protein
MEKVDRVTWISYYYWTLEQKWIVIGPIDENGVELQAPSGKITRVFVDDKGFVKQIEGDRLS